LIRPSRAWVLGKRDLITKIGQAPDEPTFERSFIQAVEVICAEFLIWHFFFSM
jgi:hypothetical protein